MADRLRVTELDFDTIKQNLKTFLKQQNQFSDYDFDGAGLSVLLDILAYNTHYNAYYTNMVANEAFLDSALLRDSVVSHAKTLGYVPYSTKSPVAFIDFTILSENNDPATITIPKGYSFLSNQIDGKTYNFVVMKDVTATKVNSTYYFEDLQIQEGQLITYNFIHDEQTNPKQIFTIPEENVDITTLSVSVSPSSGNTSVEPYNLVTDILNVTGDSKVFFLQESRSGKYQIYFGNNSVGEKLPDGAVVYISYLVTSGSESNKANGFVARSPLFDSLNESQSNFIIEVISPASGGSIREPIDSIKFNAVSQYTTQNRLVTTSDYESYIKKNYPAIDSLSVWSGDEEIPKIYGKVFVSLKPKNNYFLSELEKQRILDDIIKSKSIVSISTEIRDPDFLYVLIKTNVRYQKNKTFLSDEALKVAVKNSILLYNNTNLNKFNSTLIVSRLQDDIDSADNSFIGNDVTLRVQKRFTPILNQKSSYTINFNVPLKRGTTFDKLTSTEFNVRDTTNILRTVTIEEVPQSFTGISEILVTNPGFNYVSPPTVTITGDGSGAEAVANIVNGKLESITVTKRGFDYSRAIVTISGGGGLDAEATAVIDSKVGTLRLVYFDSNAERKIVNSNVGSINYDTGLIRLIDVNIESLPISEEIKITCESEFGIIESVRNTILSIDQEDPSSIIVDLEQV
jgi:hypothetical protein